MKLEELTTEQREKLSEFGVNTWFVMELLENYLNNPNSVAEDWRNLFASLNINGAGNGQTAIGLTAALNKTAAEQKKESVSSTAGTGLPAIPMPQPQPGE